MIRQRRIFALFVTLFALSAASCSVDLGAFDSKSDSYESYYESFGDVTGLFDGGDHVYDVKDSLFNDDTIKEMSWKKDEDEVAKEQYAYIILPFETSLTIESISLCLYADQAMDVTLSCFYFVNEDAAPKKIKYLSSPDTEPVYDSSGEIIDEKPIEYDDPTLDLALLSGNVEAAKDEWIGFGMAGFKQPGYDDNYLHTGDEGLLYLRIENNSGWNRDSMTPVTFTFVNLMIRAI